jgi:C4-dicarboxylate transporter, DctM subunit
MMTRIANVSLTVLVRESLPFLAVMIAALALVTLWPGMVLLLPRLAGYTG